MILKPWKNLILAILTIVGSSAIAADNADDENSVVPPPLVAIKASGIVVDGRIDEVIWKKAEWIGLEGSYPKIPHAPKVAVELEKEFGANVTQGKQQVKGALAWDEKGIYLAMVIEDADVQANKTRHNDWIWLEDVGEVFLAPGFPAQDRMTGIHIELQVSANGTTREQYFFDSEKNTECHLEYQVAVHVDGTINDSASLDKGYTIEWFIPWQSLGKLGFIKPGFVPSANIQPLAIRFVCWDLSLFSNIRITRFSLPGSGDVHKTQFCRPIVLK